MMRTFRKGTMPGIQSPPSCISRPTQISLERTDSELADWSFQVSQRGATALPNSQTSRLHRVRTGNKLTERTLQ